MPASILNKHTWEHRRRWVLSTIAPSRAFQTDFWSRYSFATSKSLTIPALLVVYVISRALLLDLEFTFEEPVWIKPGVNLLNGDGFVLYAGELDPEMSPFHKPPLLSVLLGLAHKLFGDSNASYRIVPFALGLFSFLIALASVRELRGPVVAFALLYIFTPFLLVGANQIQIDGSVGLFGYSLLLYACLRGLRDRPDADALIFAAGLWLTLAKTEIFVFGAAGVAAAAYLGSGWRRLWRHALVYGSSFVLGSLLIIGLSLYSRGDIGGLLEIHQVMIRIIKWWMSQKIEGELFRHAILPTLDLGRMVHGWGGSYLILAAFVAIAWALYTGRRAGTPPALALTLGTFALVPSVTYLAFGYPGDGFPRFFLIVVPACLSVVTSLIEGQLWRRIVPVLVVVYALAYAPQMREIYRSDASWTGYRGQAGFEATGHFLRLTLPEGARILGPDSVGFYYGGPYYDTDLVRPYPERWRRMVEGDLNKDLAAWVYFAPATGIPGDSELRRLYDVLKEGCRVDRSIVIGTLHVALLTPPRC